MRRATGVALSWVLVPVTLVPVTLVGLRTAAGAGATSLGNATTGESDKASVETPPAVPVEWEQWKARQNFSPTESVPEGDGLANGADGRSGEPGTTSANAPTGNAPSATADFNSDPFGRPATPVDWNAHRRQPTSTERREPAPVEPPASTGTAPTPAFRDPVVVAPTPATADGAVSVASRPFDVLIVDLQRELFRQSSYSDEPMKEMITLAALSLVDDTVDLDDDQLRDLTADEREIVRSLARFFGELRSSMESGEVSGEEAVIEAIKTLRDDVIAPPELTLPTAELCWNVRGFGSYDTFEPRRFLAGQQLILYLEIASFTSRLNNDARWVTELSQQLKIYDDASGTLQWSDPWQTVNDVSSKQRRDFYTTQKITLDERLAGGRYAFKIQVRDETTGAEAEETVMFEIVADPRLAAQPGD